jgi:hypothetical protein
MDESNEPRPMPPPPRLHWAIVAVLTVATFGLFSYVRILVLPLWVRKVRGRSTALWLLATYFGMIPPVVVVMGILAVVSVSSFVNDRLAIAGIFDMLGYGLYLATILTLMGELGSAPIGLPLRGIPTAIFGPAYFQFRLQKFPRQHEFAL